MLSVITIRVIVKGDARLAEALAQGAVQDLCEYPDERVCYEVGQPTPATPADQTLFDRHISHMEEDEAQFEEDEED